MSFIKILLWDPRFPIVSPDLLELPLEVASACVRAGVAAPVDPSQSAMLSSGGALDPGNLTEMVVWSGPPQTKKRVVMPAAVASIAAGAGVAASVGVPVAPAQQPAQAFTLAMLPEGAVLDFDAATGITLNVNRVAQWDAAIGAGSFTQATNSSRPVYAANGGPNDKAYLVGSDANTGVAMTSNEALVNNWADFLIMERPNVDQNAVASFKRILNTARLSDGLAVHILLQRAVTDASQDKVYVSQLGGNGPTARGGFGKGTGWHLFTHLFDDLNTQYSGTDGNLSTGLPPGGSTTSAATSILGYSSNDRSAIVNLARRLRLDLALMPGGGEQVANIWLIEGYLAWAYGLQDKLPSGHKYRNRAPLSSDYTGNNRLWQMWGNSLGLGTVGQLGGVLQVNANGITVNHDCVGGITSSNIKSRFDSNQDSPGGTSSGLSATKVRKKLQVFGEMFQNDSTNGVDTATGQANLASMVAAVEAAQGVAAGAAHLIIWGKWLGNGESGTTVPLLSADSFNTYLATTYPNYFLDMGRELAKLSGPDQPYADADAYSRRAISAALRSGAGDVIHLNTTGYTECAKIMKAFADAKGWTA